MGLKKWWANIRRTALEESAKLAAAKAADSALDDLESTLLGKVGAADEILDSESQIDPLDRIRAAHGIKSDLPDDHEPSDPVADAQAQLEKLKAERNKK